MAGAGLFDAVLAGDSAEREYLARRDRSHPERLKRWLALAVIADDEYGQALRRLDAASRLIAELTAALPAIADEARHEDGATWKRIARRLWRLDRDGRPRRGVSLQAAHKRFAQRG